MLPRSYNSGYSNDIRGFRKKNKPWKLYQDISPYLSAILFILLLVVGLVLNANANHERKSVARLETLHRSKELEIRNLASTLEQERRSRISAENGLRTANGDLATIRRDLVQLQDSHAGKDRHAISLQESFETTRRDLTAQRDTARQELEESRRRILTLEAESGHKEQIIEAHKAVATSREEQHSSKERQWIEIRTQLEEQLRKQGGYVPLTPPAGTPVNHPDYLATEGKSGFHFTSDGHRERYLDTAKDMFHIGVEDKDGVEHLASVMGHLMEIKQAEYAAIQKAYPVANPPPRPPIGHWMALNLERMGIKIPHGAAHLSYFLDAHFALDNDPDFVNRRAQEFLATQPGNTTGGNNSKPETTGSQPEQTVQPTATPAPGTPGVIEAALQQGQQAHSFQGAVNSPTPVSQPEQNDKLARGGYRKQHHRVDAAGFVN